MYRAERLIDGWLHIQSVPRGPWARATPEQMIQWQRERIASLEAALSRQAA